MECSGQVREAAGAVKSGDDTRGRIAQSRGETLGLHFHVPLRVFIWLYLCLLKSFWPHMKNSLEGSRRKSREAT